MNAKIATAFPFALFIVFGAHWCNLGYTFEPLVNVTAVYGPNGSTGVPYTAGQGFYNISMSVSIGLCRHAAS